MLLSLSSSRLPDVAVGCVVAVPDVRTCPRLPGHRLAAPRSPQHPGGGAKGGEQRVAWATAATSSPPPPQRQAQPQYRRQNHHPARTKSENDDSNFTPYRNCKNDDSTFVVHHPNDGHNNGDNTSLHTPRATVKSQHHRSTYTTATTAVTATTTKLSPPTVALRVRTATTICSSIVHQPNE